MTRDCWSYYMPWSVEDRTKYIMDCLRDGASINLLEGAPYHPVRYPWGNLGDPTSLVRFRQYLTSEVERRLSNTTDIPQHKCPYGREFCDGHQSAAARFLLCDSCRAIRVANGEID